MTSTKNAQQINKIRTTKKYTTTITLYTITYIVKIKTKDRYIDIYTYTKDKKTKKNIYNKVKTKYKTNNN